MKIGMMLGFEDSIKTITTIAQEAERSGIYSLYTVDAGRSATITAAAVINATHRAKVGTYIVNAFAREPWMTGLEARDLNEISGGRFVLGVGTGNLHFNDLYMGIDSTKAKAKMRDFMQIVRQVVAGRAAERVRYQGDVHRIRWRATWNPTVPTPPVFMAASGPNMVRLAGEVADGVGIGIMSSVEFVRDIVRRMRGRVRNKQAEIQMLWYFQLPLQLALTRMRTRLDRRVNEPSANSITRYLTLITIPSLGNWALLSSRTKPLNWCPLAD